MAIFRFKITLEEVDGVSREIELKSEQTFQTFHEAILKYFDLRSKKTASFFTSNTKWQKLKEITTGGNEGAEGAVDGTKESLKKLTEKSKRFVYFNEGSPQLTFLADLKEVTEEEKGDKKKYPNCAKTVGSLSSSNLFSNDEELFSGKTNLSIDDLFDDEDTSDGYEFY